MTPLVLRRLTKRTEFLFVRQGVRLARGSLLVEARRRTSAGPIGVGFTASRKVGGAVARNRARRRLREAARRLFPEYGLAGVDYVVVARAATPRVAWEALLDDMRNALIRLRADLEGGGCAPARKRREKATESD
jgi:ribonuclease P protein component